ncbi:MULTISPECIES: hypothetical protein [unclassified Bosea (in: a-proteobacteria)]|uniref:hypothetical protein n=1 Tax=unclassified Bosea (in: a-proteobacteria) TaxID=2653178 RepID=UPI000F752860|nr:MULTISPECIES: hypothetical protein [unclassified Bosea (in: a-proteobacteria)]AZO81824.1 hypothetical protein BLM15_28820 [Bosea sp. Tri-49]RXT24912.1 hypothetical protein B5U98_08040 [Bosea sp. Tri-39]RXT33464.1 hypothetical protein B5U99_18470 [Bosea sp. Tri-54]
MSDVKTTAYFGEGSPQAVAFKLLKEVAYAESKELSVSGAADSKPDRKWILDTFAECLSAAHGFRQLK